MGTNLRPPLKVGLPARREHRVLGALMDIFRPRIYFLGDQFPNPNQRQEECPSP